jgi:lipoprotein signal peptidase
MSLHPSVGTTAQHVAAIAFGVVLIDAVSKVSASYLASLNYANGIIIPVPNPDFSLGIASASAPIMLAVSTVGIFVFGGYTLWRALHRYLSVWIPGFLIGGATANLVDRMLFGAVHDWLDLVKVVVNVADLAILAGLVGYFASLAIAGRQRRHQR